MFYVHGVYTNVDIIVDGHAADPMATRFGPAGRATFPCLKDHQMTRPIRIGVLTPSSNTALEPLTCALAVAVPNCSAHFARFKVTEIALSDSALGQFDDSKILAAAELLADASPVFSARKTMYVAMPFANSSRP